MYKITKRYHEDDRTIDLTLGIEDLHTAKLVLRDYFGFSEADTLQPLMSFDDLGFSDVYATYEVTRDDDN